MTPQRRKDLLHGTLAAGLMLATVWSGLRLSIARQTAVAAAQDTQLCEQLASQIGSMRTRPAMAGLQELEMAELTKRIEQAAKEAMIAPESLVRISPEGVRRVGESAYKEKPTQLLLRQVTLRQLITFLHAVCSERGSLQVRSLRLSAPREQEVGDRWTVETTLSYLIYAPATDVSDQKRGF